MKTALDSIDRPIRDLVVNINRLGLQTVFSCCGFPYKDEEEPKSHAKIAYINFKDPESGWAAHNFFLLTSLAFKCGWKTVRYHPQQWQICYEMEEKHWRFYNKKPTEEYSLHDYELFSIAIYNLNKLISHTIDTSASKCYIVDGNQWYHDEGIHWQIEPKPVAHIKFNYNKEGKYTSYELYESREVEGSPITN